MNKIEKTFKQRHPYLDFEKYEEWRHAVYKKSNNCYVCNKTNFVKYAHHLFPKNIYRKLAYDVNNGVVLCQQCHERYHKVTPIQRCSLKSLNNFRKIMNTPLKIPIKAPKPAINKARKNLKTDPLRDINTNTPRWKKEYQERLNQSFKI